MPAELRRRVSAWLVAERDRGRSTRELAAELGIARGTITRWTRADARALVPVEVVSEPMERVVRVVSPAGFAVEGVTLAEAAALLRELG